jgi:cytochrome d ubiquinol oxidase subunit II
VPFHYTSDLRPIYEGTLFGLLNPAAIYCGLVSVAMLLTHGAAWLVFKAEGPVASRAVAVGSITALATSALFAGGGVLVWLGLLGGYRVTSPIAWDGPSNSLGKVVVADGGAWLGNFAAHPVLWLVPALGVGLRCWWHLVCVSAKAASRYSSRRSRSRRSSRRSASRCSRSCCHRSPRRATRSRCSMHRRARRRFETWVNATVVLLPIVLAYTGWVYSVLWGMVSEASIKTADHAY